MPFTEDDREFLRLLVKDAIHDVIKEHMATEHEKLQEAQAAYEARLREIEGKVRAALGWAAGAGAAGSLLIAFVGRTLKLI